MCKVWTKIKYNLSELYLQDKQNFQLVTNDDILLYNFYVLIKLGQQMYALSRCSLPFCLYSLIGNTRNVIILFWLWTKSESFASLEKLNHILSYWHNQMAFIFLSSVEFRIILYSKFHNGLLYIDTLIFQEISTLCKKQNLLFQVSR